MDFIKTKHGEVMALARLLNVTETELVEDAKSWQHGIERIDQIDDMTYRHLMHALDSFALLKSKGQAEKFSDIYEDDDEDACCDGEDEEKFWDDFMYSRKYRDYCETQYGWDCS